MPPALYDIYVHRNELILVAGKAIYVMPAEIINLRQVRKQKARQDKEQRSAENRAKHGRTKRERLAAEDANNRQSKMLDHAQLQNPRSQGGKADLAEQSSSNDGKDSNV